MRISAALAWYDEPVAFLQRCLTSLVGLVDELVTLDGRCSNHPGVGFLSPYEQGAALEQLAYIWGLRAKFATPRAPYPTQVAKRAELMRLASEDADWVFVIDGDEYVAESDAVEVRARLEASDLRVGEVAHLNLNPPMPGAKPRAGLTRRFYRAGTTVEVVHSGYVYEGEQLLAGEPTVDLRDVLLIHHDNFNRGEVRNAAALTYREQREVQREEVWVTA